MPSDDSAIGKTDLSQKRPNEAMLWTKIITNFDPLKKVLQNRTDITY